MMKQAYYTSCRVGRSVDGGSGFRLRACSSGMSPGRIEAAVQHAGYSLPAGMVPSDDMIDEAPVRLALLDDNGCGRMLVHSCYVGRDPGTRRFGNFFSHLLVDVPPSVGAGQAINTWGSRDWQCQDGEWDIELPDRDRLPGDGPPCDANLQQFLADPSNRRMTAYLLAALLQPDESSRVFIAAPADRIGMAIAVVCRALPAAAIRSLTFSTYESDPLTSHARLVGTCWPEDQERDLPSSCYNDNAFSFNSYTDRRLEIDPWPAFADFAIDVLAAGSVDRLSAITDVCERLGVVRAETVNTVYQVTCRPEDLVPDAVQSLVRDHAEAAMALLLEHPGALTRIFEWATTDPGHAEMLLRPLAARAVRSEAAIGRMARAVGDSLLDAILHPQDDRAGGVRAEMVSQLPVWIADRACDPRILSWPVRLLLLPHVECLAVGMSDRAAASRSEHWLDLPREEVAEFLAADLSEELKVAVLERVIRREEKVPCEAVARFEADPMMLVAVMQRLLAAPGADDLAVPLFRVVIDGNPDLRVIEVLTSQADRLGQHVTRACLERVVADGRFDPGRLVQHAAKILLAEPPDRVICQELAGRLLAQIEPTGSEDSAITGFLETLERRHLLTETQRVRFESIRAVQDFLRHATLGEAGLVRLAAAMANDPDPTARQASKVAKHIGEGLVTRPAGRGARTVLELVLRTLGPTFEGGPMQLYRTVLEQCRQDGAFWRDAKLLHAFITLGLGECRQLHESLEDLSLAARDLAEEMARRSGTAVFRRVESEIISGSGSARRQWLLFAKFIKPGRLTRLGRLFRRVATALLSVIGVCFLWQSRAPLIDRGATSRPPSATGELRSSVNPANPGTRPPQRESASHSSSRDGHSVD